MENKDTNGEQVVKSTSAPAQKQKRQSKPKPSMPQATKRRNKMTKNDINTTSIEKENLEAHVELCAERYKQLNNRLEIIEVKVSEISKVLEESKSGLAKVIIGATGTVVAGIISVIVTLLMKF